jgi:hypothetical protein
MPQLDFDGANSKISADKIQGQSGTTVTIPAGHNLVGDGSGLTSLTAANITSGGTLPVLNGSNLTGVSGGKVLQVVYSDDDIKVSQGTTSTSLTDVLNDASSTFELAITPSATTSDLLIFGHMSTISTGSVADCRTYLAVLGKIGAGSYAQLHPSDVQGLYADPAIASLQLSQDVPFNLLWSPSTMSECKIKFQHSVNNASSTSWINSNGVQNSSVTIMELDGS